MGWSVFYNMQSQGLDTDGFLIFTGLVMILISFISSCRLLRRLKLEDTRKAWKAMVTLVAGFVLGYAAMLFSKATGHSDSIPKLTSLILCFGGVFVFLTQIISGRMNTALQGYSDHLEQLVEERTVELTSALKKLSASQEALLVVSRMSALSEMAGGVAHEINSPLAAIKIITSLTQEMLNAETLDKPQLKKMASNIDGSANRIAKIVQGLRSFSRDGRKDPFQNVNVRELIDETLSFCEERFKDSGITLSVEEFRKDLCVEGRATQLSQVILNLLGNAYDAIVDTQDKWIKISVLETANDVEIRITDCCKGIPEDIQKKIFQPFFTTKEIGKGTGMGLSISIGIVQIHRGELMLDTKSPNTCFVIRLPKIQGTSLVTSTTG